MWNEQKWNTGGDLPSEAKVEAAKALYDRQVLIAQDAKTLEQLTLNNYINSIQNLVSKYDYMIPQLHEAWTQQSEKYKKDRKTFHAIETILQQDFFGDSKNFKLKSIQLNGYERYGYSFEFEYKYSESRIQIFIPNRKELNATMLPYAHEGKFAFLIETSENCWKVIYSKYRFEDLAKVINEYYLLDCIKED